MTDSDMFFSKVLRAGLENQLPHHFKDTLRIASARLFNLQSKKRAWIVGKEHDRSGNDLFSRMLDPFMQYSCAYWKDADNLESAQQVKLKMICEKLQLKPGMRVLDIGCGWGGLAHYMASNYDVSVVGVTISAEQQKMAQERCEGLDVTILLQDYRDLNDQFDRIVSAGDVRARRTEKLRYLFCGGGSNFLNRKVYSCSILSVRKKPIWMLIPGLINIFFRTVRLPSVRQIAQSSEPHFVMEDWHNFGADYDTTLMAWYERFLAAWPEIADNYSERFKRMFTYYLNACAGAFRRYIELWQVVFSRGVENGLRVAR
ncbi:cyclopropane fatty acyl phospholipid synthase [Escherichia coli]